MARDPPPQTLNLTRYVILLIFGATQVSYRWPCGATGKHLIYLPNTGKGEGGRGKGRDDRWYRVKSMSGRGKCWIGKACRMGWGWKGSRRWGRSLNEGMKHEQKKGKNVISRWWWEGWEGRQERSAEVEKESKAEETGEDMYVIPYEGDRRQRGWKVEWGRSGNLVFFGM